MNDWRSILFILVLSLASPAGWAQDPKPDAFGFRLGDYYEASQAVKRIDIQGRYSVFVVTPLESFASMSHVVLTLTKSSQIRSIEGSKRSSDCNREIEDVKRAVESKYWFLFKFDDRFYTNQGGLGWTRGIDQHEIGIICVDNVLRFRLDANWFRPDDFK
jgi:hypothetical protein